MIMGSKFLKTETLERTTLKKEIRKHKINESIEKPYIKMPLYLACSKTDSISLSFSIGLAR